MTQNKIISAKNPVWANPEKDSVNMTIRMEGIEGDLPFHATPYDVVEYGRDLYARAIKGEFGKIADWIPPPLELVASRMKEQRDMLLASTDWTQLPDVPQTLKNKWAVYRQALRDITKQEGYPRNIVWPEQPV